MTSEIDPPAHQKPSVKAEPKEEEYELVPLNPIRRIEKRVERIEHAGVPSEAIHELVDAVRTNQQLVEEVIKLNTEMIRRVSDLTSSVSELATRINTLVDRLQMAEVPEEKERHKAFESKMENRLEKMEKRLNALIIATMPRRPRVAPPPGPPPMM